MRATQENPKYICECGELIDYTPGQDCPECGAEIVVVHPNGTTEAPTKPKMMSQSQLETIRDEYVSKLSGIADNTAFQREARRSLQSNIDLMNVILRGGN